MKKAVQAITAAFPCQSQQYTLFCSIGSSVEVEFADKTAVLRFATVILNHMHFSHPFCTFFCFHPQERMSFLGGGGGGVVLHILLNRGTHCCAFATVVLTCIYRGVGHAALTTVLTVPLFAPGAP